MIHFFLGIALMIISNSCSSNVENVKPHHTNNGFRNLNFEAEAKGFGDVLLWQFSRLFQDLPSLDPADYKFEILQNNGESLRINKNKLSATWVGHATVLIQIDGKNILTDPIWSERCSPISFLGPKRYTPVGIKIDDLPNIHIVLISHNHYDHMDIPTLKELEKRFSPHFFVGLKNGKLLRSEGLQKIVELDWWDSYSIFDLEINFTPTQHFSARGILDRNKTLWGSFVVRSKNYGFYFAGDTGYFSGFLEIGKKFPNLDLAILPIGAYEPRWFMKPVHMNPVDSVKAFLDLNAKYMIPMHYQTFVLTDEALDEPLRFTKEEFAKQVKDISRLIDLKIGETRFFD